MKTVKIIILTAIIFLVCVYYGPVQGAKVGCMPDVDCTTPASGCDPPCTPPFRCCAIDDGGVTIPVKDDPWVKKVLGDKLVLNIMKPLAFWDMEGTASIWAVIAMIFGIAFPLLFIAFIVAVAIGAMKWMSSGGQEAKLQSAQKWIKNAVMGFVGTALVFVAANVACWWLGIGSIFDLAQNLSVCGGETLYSVKQGIGKNVPSDKVWYCNEDTNEWDWRDPIIEVEEPPSEEE